MRVLLVEDEALLASTLAIGLRAEGCTVVESHDGVDGLRRACEGVTGPAGGSEAAAGSPTGFDVVVLDIMLPGLSGYEVLRRMRARGVTVPVIMLTAKDGEYDQTDAFELGADDYLTKPFSFLVLMARLRALVRRAAPPRPAVLRAGSLVLDPASREVRRGGTPIALTPREYGLLEFLMRHRDTVLTKAEILRGVWEAHDEHADNVVEVYVGYLRRKIDVPFGASTIQTVRGVGYRLYSGSESDPGSGSPDGSGSSRGS